ncbi:MAG: methyltransferase domain-containing protein [Gammaproteobacteria bacterium]
MLDQKIIRRGFSRAAARFEERDFLHAEIRRRLLERLETVRLEPRMILDLGCGTGAALPDLRSRFPRAGIVPLDLTHAMLRAGAASRGGICADAARLPLEDHSIDVIFSNLMLHHCPDPAAVLAEARRVLRAPGLITLTTFGPDNLRELGRAWATADRYSHVSPFTDMHDVGDALVRAGFSEPVIDSQALTITYGAFESLINDLRAAGATNATEHRNRGLTGREAAGRLRAAWQALAASDGRTPITVEVIFGIAWAGDETGRRAPGDPIEIPVERLGSMHRKRR